MERALMEFGRIDASPDLEASLMVTYQELRGHFVDALPFGIGRPLPLPNDRIQAVANGELKEPDRSLGPFKSFHPKPGPTSSLKQIGHANSFRRPDGSTGSSVTLVKKLVNRTTVKKDDITEPERIFNEISNARVSMASLGLIVLRGSQPDGMGQFDELNSMIDELFPVDEDESPLK
ncbi:MAG: hypothetical protein Q9183_005356 [Haloplaca sp. 2 TL-2023]